MSGETRRNAITEVRRLLGLGRPAAGWWRWLRDPYFLLCMLAAVPVWLALGASLAGGTGTHPALSYAVSLLLVQPVVEELVFRGALQGVLLERGWSRRIAGVSLANIVTSAAFVATHFIAQPPAWALAVAVPSLLFGYLRERLASVLPPIALHAVYNAGFLATLACVQR